MTDLSYLRCFPLLLSIGCPLGRLNMERDGGYRKDPPYLRSDGIVLTKLKALTAPGQRK